MTSNDITYTCQRATEDHISEIVTLTESQLGESYIPRDEIQAAIDSPTQHLYIAKSETPTETEGYSVLGFCLSSVYDQQALAEYMNLTPDEFTAYLSGYPVGVIQTVCVREQFQHNGIGTTVTRQTLDQLTTQDPTEVISLGWKADGTVNIEPLLLRLGFTQVTEFTEYWKQESLTEQYSCPNCGDPPCTCSAILFTYNET